MTSPALARAVALLGPFALTALAWIIRRPRPRWGAAAFLAFAWNFVALWALNLGAVHWGAWVFHTEGGMLLGVPVDLLIGWSLLWGPLPFLIQPRIPLLVLGAALLWLDSLLMPLADSVVHLNRGWLLADAGAVVLGAFPSQLLGRWTLEDRRLNLRAFLLAICFCVLVLGVVPSTALSFTGEAPQYRIDALLRWVDVFSIQILFLPAVVGLSAVQEFATRGHGTPLPFDPPRCLVLSGVYSYVANPMQMSTALILLLCSAFSRNLLFAAVAVTIAIYSFGLASWSEGQDLVERFGPAWLDYRRSVRAWWPRWRPWVPNPARLYVARGCDLCSELGAWMGRLSPIGLELIPAEEHPTRDLDRLTYEPALGERHEVGVAALARALEHCNLAWAWLGWLMRLPGARFLIQIVFDASGGGARRVIRLNREPR